ncbi:nucleoside diphosphate kinase homolog 7 isoform X2 [Arctopsyche grandis]|uniref:nucleoside diphosphate kinase homolog 7 isoform X2 n=1 Tax=Arctopsyche grandis TaxID=121162 RepID=UPI00406D6846
MDCGYSEKFSFIGEWYDHNTNLTQNFVVHYFPSDSSIELFDVKNRKTFLRRSIVEGLSADEFHIDGSIKVYARLIKLTDYGNEYTKRKLGKSVERAFAMIKPVSNDHLGDIIQCIQDRNYKIKQLKMSLLTKDSALQACQSIRDDQNLESILNDITSGPVIGLELVCQNAVQRWNSDMSEINTHLCEKYNQNHSESAPNKYFYGSGNLDDALHDLSYFFPTGKLKSLGPTMAPSMINCTCCVIKPHAIRDGNLGKIIKAITDERFVIMTMKMFYMDNVSAAEFYEVYKGVVPDYMGMVAELISGPCVAMEIVGPADVNTPVEFRKLVGPIDPDMARQIRPHTLRARFGSTRTQNAVHCSDLPEDGVLEVEYFFKILD